MLQVNCVAATRVRAQLPKPQNALHLQHGARLLALLLMANVLLVLIIISAVKERLPAAVDIAISLALLLSLAIKINFKLKRLI